MNKAGQAVQASRDEIFIGGKLFDISESYG